VIRVNLLPQKRGSRAAAGPQTSQRWLLVVAGVVVLECIGLLVFHQGMREQLAAQQDKNARLDGQIADIKKLVSNHEEIKKQLAVLRAREDAIAKLQAARSGPTAVMLELAQILTPSKGPTIDQDRFAFLRRENPNLNFSAGWDCRRLWMTSYLETDRTVRVEGMARDGSDVAELAQRFKLSSYFYDVTLLPGKKEPEKDVRLEVVNFALQLKVRY
jgi:type IV pilus assembly protein PilN